MKFLAFNIVVAIALIYLATDRFSGGDVALPGLNGVSAAAERLIGGDPAPEPSPPDEAPVAQPANPFSILETDRAVAVKPLDSADAAPAKEPATVAPATVAPVVDAPAIAPADLAAPAKTFVAEAPAPLDASVARRRAEVLGEALPAAPPVQPAAERRRQLLDLAEQMEYMAAEFAAR